MGLLKSKAPSPRVLPFEWEQILQMMPRMLQSDQQTRPGYTTLNNQTLRQSLLGSEGQPGLVQTFGDVMPEATRISLQDRTAAAGNIRELNPNNARLGDMLTQAGAQDVALGSRLDPQQMGQIRNQVLGSTSNRGWGYNPGDMAAVGMETGAAGEALRSDRLGRAQNIGEFSSRNFTLPALSGSGGTGLAAQLFGAGGVNSASPDYMPMVASYGSDLFNTNYNAQAAANIATANNRTALVSSLASC